MAINICRPKHFSQLSASGYNSLILEVIFLFVPFKYAFFSSILYIVMDCLSFPSLDFDVINDK
jgi:general stress protein CsbA